MENFTIYSGKGMENYHVYGENLWKISPFIVGKVWKITMFMGKTYGTFHHF